jgi:hypothetical protein
MSLKEVLLTIAGFGAVIVILLEAITRVRDKLVELGWIAPTSWLGAMVYRRRRADICSVLQEVGFDGGQFLAVKNSLITRLFRRRGSSKKQPLEEQIIETLRPWIKLVPEGFHREGVINNHYIDTMGAMYYSSADQMRLSELLAQWIVLLQHHAEIPSFDVLLSNKEGNTKLVDEACNCISPNRQLSTIVCKGERDASRVGIRGTTINRIDFEGLEAFLLSSQSRADRAKADSSFQFRVIAADDNCTSGKSLISAIQRFNRLIQQDNLPFMPITHAVTLFAIKSEITADTFANANVVLHTVFSLGNSEMEQIKNEPTRKLLKQVGRLKDGYGCDFSKARKIEDGSRLGSLDKGDYQQTLSDHAN